MSNMNTTLAFEAVASAPTPRQRDFSAEFAVIDVDSGVRRTT
jgi:hypothetical protein